jgi:transposase-like protein
MAHNRRQREQLVRQWKQSGLTAAQFAEPLGIAPHSLHNWAWALRGGKRRKSSVREQRVRLLKVQVTPAQRGLSPQAEGRSQSSRALLELTADGRIRIDFSTDADPGTLAALVALLRGATC